MIAFSFSRIMLLGCALGNVKLCCINYRNEKMQEYVNDGEFFYDKFWSMILGILCNQ
jgi:hypothetical protein